MLRSIELEVLGIVESGDTISGLADALEFNESYISGAVSALSQKGLVQKQREGHRKRIVPSEANVVTRYQDLVQQHPDIDFPRLLTRKAFEIVYHLGNRTTVSQIADASGNYRNTVNRILKRLENHGIVRKRNAHYSLETDFDSLYKFVREITHHLHNQRLRSIAGDETANKIDCERF